MEELKPCPFCGGRAYKSSCTSSVRCSNCGAVGADYSILNEPADVRMKKAVNAWNTRHEQTCENVGIEPLDFECGECHFAVSVDPSYGVNWQTNFWKYCPDCGAKVVDNG